MDQAFNINQREVRVFLSSTFRDMKQEREVLVKKIFPQLRKLCAERFVTFSEVDLRWGITNEQKDEGQVLPLCLAEIERCRPYFIGILGERYGWIPDGGAFNQRLLSDQPWLTDYKDGASVTELEIIHGVLADHAMRDKAFFYFRAPEKSREIEEELKKEPDYQAEPEASSSKLQALKKNIRISGYPVYENYTDAEAFGQMVLNQLSEAIETLYPKSDVPSEVNREAVGQESYAISKRFAYVERPTHSAVLDRYAENDPQGKGLVLIGESGCGKTAILASWTDQWRTKHPKDFLIQHYLGATPESASALGCVRRLLGELKERYSLTEDIPADSDKLREALPLWLGQTVGKGKIIIVLDGLNQIEGEERDKHLDWLPQFVPSHVRIITSALPGTALEELRKREWQEHIIPLIDILERKEIIKKFLNTYRKTLTEDLFAQLAEAPGSANPLYLRTALEELRIYGSHEGLSKHIITLTKATTPAELFRLVIGRWIKDYSPGRSLASTALKLLWAARQGLSEHEWIEIIEQQGNSLPRSEWTHLLLAMEPHLVQKIGLYNFGHPYFKEAVEAEFLSKQENRQQVHLVIADYFNNQPNGIRRIRELPYQLSRANSWHKLVKLLITPDFFLSAWELDEYDVRTRWAEVTSSSTYRIDDAYEEVLAQQPMSLKFGLIVSFLLRVSGKLKFAANLQHKIIESARNIDDNRTLAEVLGLHANTLFELGNYSDVSMILQDQIKLWRNLKDQKHLQAALGNLAVYLSDCGRDIEALPIVNEQETICRNLPNKFGLYQALLTSSIIHYRIGQIKVSELLLEEAESLCREKGLYDWLQAILGNRVALFFDQGKYSEAMQLNLEKESICRRLGFKRGLAFALHHQGRILFAISKASDALECHHREEMICREMDFDEGLQASLREQAKILSAQGEHSKALLILQQCEDICRKLGHKRELALALRLKGDIFCTTGEFNYALNAYKEEERLHRAVNNLNALQLCLGNLAIFQRKSGNVEAAIILHKEEIGLCRQLQLPYMLQAAIGNLALAYQAHGDIDDTLRSLEEQQSICKENGLMDGLVRSLYNQARFFFYVLGQVENARKTVIEALEIAHCHKLGQLATSLDELLKYLNKRNDKKPDIAYKKSQDELSKISSQVAKILLMESVTETVAVGPWDPTSLKVGPDNQFDMLKQALQSHAEDCQSLCVDIPMLLGVPQRFAEQTKAYIENLNYGGLRRDQVHLIIEADVPGFDANGQLVMVDPYNMRTFMAGGGISLANAVAEGILAILWKQGIRWLFCTYVANYNTIARSPILRHLPECNSDIIAEIVDYNAFPASKVHALILDDKNFCIDQRLLSEQQLSEVGTNGYVSTGTFWISCEKFANILGITCSDLNNPWDQAKWKDKINLPEEYGIIAISNDNIFALIVPLWEIIRPLNMEFIKVAYDRLP
jgi:tetratricopeptide (TPR) repeat protein